MDKGLLSDIVRLNKLYAWYQICKKYKVVKDIRTLVIKRGYLEEEPSIQLLSTLQKWKLFNALDMPPSERRRLLNVSYMTVEERYTQLIGGLAVLIVPILLLVWQYSLRKIA